MTRLSVTDALETVVAALPSAEIRSGQRTMASAVDEALTSQRHLVVQAGTGTGKTLAYLVPAFMSGRRVIVTTATKALQDQLADKDLPLLVEQLVPLLDHEVTWAVLKGRNNYLCKQRLKEISGTATLPAGDDSVVTLFDPDELAGVSREDVARLATWARTSDTGDRTELTWSVSDSTWRAVSVGSDECPGASRCPSGDECFAELARVRASEADLVVVNTHLYGAHVASDGTLLPEHDVVIIDEAHGLEDIMSDSAGISVHAGRIRFLGAAVARIIDDRMLSSRITQIGDALSARLTPLVGQRLSVPLPTGITDDLISCRQVTADILDALRRIEAKDDNTQQRRLRAQTLTTRLSDDIDQALSISSSFVPFVSGTDQAPRLDIAPLDVGPVLKAAIWDSTTAILTSATIPLNLAGRIGLDLESTDIIDVESPFDYQSQAVLYCSAHLPNPNESAYADRMHDELLHLIRAAGGRTLALFTSYRAMDAAVEAIRGRVDVTVLSQREHSKSQLVALFSREETSCLFATSGFFQGIDIPGRTLSLVTLDRIPFPRPDDPLLSARREAVGSSAFREIDIPRAATLLAQATGRLIRSVADRGVVAVFDPRLATSGYRRHILQALPPMRRSIDRAEVEDFLRSVTS